MKWYLCTISFYWFMDKKTQSTLLLLTTSIIWGSSFIVMKNAVDFLTPATLLMVRFSLAALFLTIMFFNKVKTIRKDQIIGGILTGFVLFIAYFTQTWGLYYTTPGKNAFLSGLYCAFVPFCAWFFYKKKPENYHFIAAFLTLIGIGFVSLDSSLTMEIGDILTIGSSVLYALHIMMIQKYSNDVDSDAFTCLQFYGGSLLAFVFVLLFEDISILSSIESSIYLQIFYLSFFCTALAMLWQTNGLKHVDECKASLLLSLESVFGVLFSVIFYKEVLKMKVLIGFIIIFIAIVISQTQLTFLKKIKIGKIFVALLTVSTLLGTCNMNTISAVSVSAPYCYVYDLTTDQTLYTKSANEKIYPASMTKVMTALVALEHIEDLSAVITMENYDFKGLWEEGASQVGFEVGEKATYRDLIYGIILPSGADACRALARSLFGTEEKMAEAMNKKAQELGLTNTHFVNTSGLHNKDHYTTVYEMGVITKEALKDPFLKEVFSTRTYRSEISNRYMAATILKFQWNTGTSIKHIIGCKTGYTSDSRSCLTALVDCDGNEVIVVVARADSSSQYVADAKSVKNYYTDNYHPVTVLNKGDVITTVQVKNGVKESIDVAIKEDVMFYVKNSINKEDFKVNYVGENVLKAPVEVGTSLGNIEISLGDEKYKTIPLETQEFVDMTTFAKVVKFVSDNILIIGVGVIATAGIVVLTIKNKTKKEII